MIVALPPVNTYPMPDGPPSRSPAACAKAWSQARVAAEMCDDGDQYRREVAKVKAGIEQAVAAGVCALSIRRRTHEEFARANAASRLESHTIDHSKKTDRLYTIPFKSIAETLPPDCGMVRVFLPDQWDELPRVEQVYADAPEEQVTVFTADKIDVANGVAKYRVSYE